MNAHELAAALANRAPEIAEHLLPHGKRSSGEWKAGNVDGEAGKSLSVRISGDRRGLWRDFAADQGGDLLDLWAATRRISISEAMAEAKRYLGIRDDVRLETAPKLYRRPARKPETKPAASNVLAWLRSRGLTDETVAAFKVSQEGEDTAVFPYLRDGELVNVKRRSITEKRKMWQEKDAEPCLFGWHLIEPMARVVAIAEGEIDAMTLHQVGIPALSVNAGAGNHQWIESDWERLQRFSEILLCYDNDDAGRKGAAEVAKRLGLERCRIVKFPGVKDANELLTEGANADVFKAAIHDSESIDPDELVSVARFTDEVIEEFNPVETGYTAPALHIGVDHDWFRFRPAEVTVWTGYNGHGKSLLLGLVQLGLIDAGEKVVIFSGEMAPRKLLHRMTRQATGMSNPSIAYIRRVMAWLSRSMWLFDVRGVANGARMLEVFAYAVRRYGVTHCVIDSLMMLEDVPEDGKGALEAQRKFMVQVAGFAKKHGVHVHLVAHPRKAENERMAPGKQDVSGSGKISNLADNHLSVWAKLKDEDEPGDDGPDAKIEVNKQRNGDVQHRSLWLWFDRDSMQHTCTSKRHPRRFAQEEAA